MGDWDDFMAKRKAEDFEKRMKERIAEEEEKDRAERAYMIGKLLRMPCGICGSVEHKAITEGITGDQSTIEYECPAAFQDQWDPGLHRSIFQKNITVDPYKFAQMFSFQKDLVEAAIPNLKEFGSGKYDHQIRWFLLKKHLLEICDEQKECERRFKRDTRVMETDEDDEGSDL